MARIEWDQTGERRFETGVDRCVFYPSVGAGIPWNGVTGISESSEADVTPLYNDGIKYFDYVPLEDFKATLEAFSSPDEFRFYDGWAPLATGLYATCQKRKTFSMTYRTQVGNDLEGTDHGYKIHFVWNITSSPASRAHNTISDSPEPMKISWELNAVPPLNPDTLPDAYGYAPTAHMILDTTVLNDPVKLAAVEDYIYTTDPGFGLSAMPTQAQLVELLL